MTNVDFLAFHIKSIRLTNQHVDVWQKPTQFCKAIIRQLKKKRFTPGIWEDPSLPQDSIAMRFPDKTDSLSKEAVEGLGLLDGQPAVFMELF